jgi:uncharacterized protein
MIKVEVVNTFLVNMGKEFVILLRGTEDERTLPISIGQLEAQSIAFQINNIPFPRPLTHDLFKNILSKLNGSVVRTEICTLKDETFFANLILQINDKVITIDSRPSDAIALALRFSAPIFVDDNVMDEAGIIIPEADQASKKDASSAFEKHDTQREITSVELLREQLEVAVSEERYEDAARIKNEISKLTKSN